MEEDKKLYNKFLNGEKSALDLLISKYKNNVIYFISRYVKNVDIAEDIFQDVILYILENKENYKFNYSFKTYLYIIAKSKALNYIKKHEMQFIDLSNISDDVSEDKLLEIIFSNERKSKLKKVIKKLKTNYQIVIYLTQIEGLTYKETAQILNKTEKQVKNLAYNAKKSLKKLLINEKMIEMKNNKFIRLLSIILIVGVITSGIVCATIIIKNMKNNAKLNASFAGSVGNINENKVWVGTFQIAWNELMESLGNPIEFEEGASQLAEDLNKQSFTKDMLNENSYYIAQGQISPELKEQIDTDIKNKFNTKSEFLNNIDWKATNEYLIYSMLNKNFTFETPFIEKNSDNFGNSEEKVKYFGLDATTLEETFKQVTVLFYNSDNDFAVKIATLEGEEVILYRTDNVTDFENTYLELEEKTNSYNGRTTMIREKDELKVPFIKVKAVINYDELCNKTIKNSNGAYIKYAMQNVDFSLDNYGGNIKSEAYVDIYMSSSLEKPRYFNFTDNFVLFLKEESKEKPYFALLVDNTDVLVKE